MTSAINNPYIKHTIQYAFLFPMSTCLGKALNLPQHYSLETLTNLIFNNQTDLNATSNAVDASAFSWSPITEGNREVTIAAFAVGILTSLTFQSSRNHIEALKKHQKLAMLGSFSFASVAVGLNVGTNSQAIYEVMLSTLIVGGGITITAKTTEYLRHRVKPLLVFLDLTSIFTSNKTKDSSGPKGKIRRRVNVARQIADPSSPLPLDQLLSQVDEKRSKGNDTKRTLNGSSPMNPVTLFAESDTGKRSHSPPSFEKRSAGAGNGSRNRHDYSAPSSESDGSSSETEVDNSSSDGEMSDPYARKSTSSNGKKSSSSHRSRSRRADQEGGAPYNYRRRRSSSPEDRTRAQSPVRPDQLGAPGTPNPKKSSQAHRRSGSSSPKQAALVDSIRASQTPDNGRDKSAVGKFAHQACTKPDCKECVDALVLANSESTRTSVERKPPSDRGSQSE